MTWSAKQYTMFEQQRTRPVRDLVAAIPNTEVNSAVDLGCGPGNSTEVLAERFPHAHVTGMDSSDDMLLDARKRLPRLNFELADIGAWHPAQRLDVILANASLQWLPDHATLYPHLVHQLNPGGTLAVQTPDNLDEPAHRLAREVAADGPWAAKIGAVKHNERPHRQLLLRTAEQALQYRGCVAHHLSAPVGGPRGGGGVVQGFGIAAFSCAVDRR